MDKLFTLLSLLVLTSIVSVRADDWVLETSRTNTRPAMANVEELFRELRTALIKDPFEKSAAYGVRVKNSGLNGTNLTVSFGRGIVEPDPDHDRYWVKCGPTPDPGNFSLRFPVLSDPTNTLRFSVSVLMLPKDMNGVGPGNVAKGGPTCGLVLVNPDRETLGALRDGDVVIVATLTVSSISDASCSPVGEGHLINVPADLTSLAVYSSDLRTRYGIARLVTR
jgi:hypothetical protein